MLQLSGKLLLLASEKALRWWDLSLSLFPAMSGPQRCHSHSNVTATATSGHSIATATALSQPPQPCWGKALPLPQHCHGACFGH